jgi:hypothetical protein
MLVRRDRAMTTTAAESSIPAAAPGSNAPARPPSRLARLTPDSRAWLVGLFAVGLWTFLPALISPLVLDDYLHSAMVRGLFPAPRGPFDLYDFASNADRRLLIERGILPWWTHPEFTIRFFRPLSSLLLWTDHRVFGGHPILLHLPSFVYWAIAVLGARRIFSRALAPRPAVVATTIFALGPWHAIPLGWLANSEALISLALGIFALDRYLVWREEKTTFAGALAFVLFSLALLGGEYALCLGGYCLALEIVDRPDGWTRALGRLLPFVVPAAGYLGVRGWLHYGALGTSFYADPLRDPDLFLRLFPLRFAALLSDGWLTIPSESWGFGDGRWGAVVFAAVAAVPLAFVIRKVLAELPEKKRKTAEAWVLGSLFAMIPVATVVPAARLLGVSAIGISGIVALVLEEAWWSERALPKIGRSGPHAVGTPATPAEKRAREIVGTVAIFLGFAQLVHGPVTAWLSARQMRTTAVDFIEHTEWLRDKIPAPDAAEVMVIRAGGGIFFGPFAVGPEGRPPARWRTLSHTGHVMVLRKGPRTLELVTPREIPMFPGGDGNLFRTPERPFRVGDVVRVPGMNARIEALGPNGPTRVRFDFDEDIDSPAYVWTAEDAIGFKSAELPKIGFGAPFDP